MKNKKNEIEIVYNKKKYTLCEYMYGVLTMDHNNPLCCVSESNNSFSIDYWKGCPYQCAYCHVQGIYEDLDQNYHMYKTPIPRSKFSIKEIIDALIEHPFFEKNNSIISIATSSTEPFANPMVTENTLNIMEYFVELGLKNPFWIVTKAGIPKGISERLKKICENGNNIMISLCYAGNPKLIEPVNNNRFKNIEELENTGVCISWYLRPLVKEWGANKQNLTEMFKCISNKYGKYIDIIVPGGLRWTDGIEFGLKIQHGLKMPKLIKKYDQKTLSTNIENIILELCEEYFPTKPVYFNSSCAMAHMLNKNNIALLNILKPEICKKSKCYNFCKDKCMKTKFTNDELFKIEQELHKQGFNFKVIDVSRRNKIKLEPDLNDFDYTVKQQVKKTIAMAINKL